MYKTLLAFMLAIVVVASFLACCGASDTDTLAETLGRYFAWLLVC